MHFEKKDNIMRTLRFGVASVNTTVGAVKTNTNKGVRAVRELADLKCDIIVLQEQFFGGYPAEDLVQWPLFVSSQMQELLRFARETSNLDALIVVGIAVSVGGLVYNANALVCKGRIIGFVPKEHLPTYGVFYEKRVFTPGVPGMYAEIECGLNKVPFGDLVFDFPFGTLTTCVCEDSWTGRGPIGRRDALVQLVTNASPFRQGVVETRREMLRTRSADNECVLVAAYQVGGNDSLVFDGGGFFYQNGRSLMEAPRFREGTAFVDLDLDESIRLRNENTTWRTLRQSKTAEPEPRRVLVTSGPSGSSRAPVRPVVQNPFLPDPLSEPAVDPRKGALDDLIETETLGLADYVEKTGKGKVFDRILIALSGGKDSALTLLLAWLYAKRRFVHLPAEEQAAAIRSFIVCVSMPTKFNSEGTRGIARNLAEELGVDFHEEPIQEAYERECEAVTKITGEPVTKTTRGNIQARIRGMRMWNLSNELKGLWIQTGNMSEKAVGYTTIGGDLMGGYSLLGNMPKTVVTVLIAYIGSTYPRGPITELLAQRASAELADGQFDEDELMPYEILDACFLSFVGGKRAPVELYRAVRATWSDERLETVGADVAKLKEWIKRFLSLFFASIYKWVHSPQAVHLGSLDLDRERALQLPVVQSMEWLEESITKMDSLP